MYVNQVVSLFFTTSEAKPPGKCLLGTSASQKSTDPTSRFSDGSQETTSRFSSMELKLLYSGTVSQISPHCWDPSRQAESQSHFTNACIRWPQLPAEAGFWHIHRTDLTIKYEIEVLQEREHWSLPANVQ